MAYDEELAGRIRDLVAGERGLTEQKMFGGLSFLVGGNMAVAASGQGGLLVRVDPDESDALVEATPAYLMEMRGRKMRGWLRLDCRSGAVEGGARDLGRARRVVRPLAPRQEVVLDDDGYFDERVAARYDESEPEMFDPAVVDPVVDFLAELAGNGRALELGIGTGRIALPLARRGVPVHGIELSKAMAARLRAKPGGEEIGVTIGDFATTTRGGNVLRRVPGLQHDHEPDDAGGAGRLLPQRRGAPRARRLLRHRGRRPVAPAAPARRDHPRLRLE